MGTWTLGLRSAERERETDYRFGGRRGGTRPSALRVCCDCHAHTDRDHRRAGDRDRADPPDAFR